MHKNNIIKYLQSVVVLPMLALSSPMIAPAPGTTSPVPVITQNTTAQASLITTDDDKASKDDAAKIDAFFASKNAPLVGYGQKFVAEADKYNIDRRLLPAIAMRETGGGKEACKNPKAPNNDFGWASCKAGFVSIDASIEHIAKTLSGNNPNVAHYKDGMTTEQILKKYNPDSIVPGYSKQVIKIMKMIDDKDVA